MRHALARVLSLLVLLAALPADVLAQGEEAARGPAAVEPLITSETVAVQRYDLNRLDVDALDRWLGDLIAESDLPVDEKQAIREDVQGEQLRQLRELRQKLLDAGAPVLYTLFELGDRGPAPLLFVPLRPGADTAALREALGVDERDASEVNGGLLMGPRQRVQAMRNTPAAADANEPLRAALRDMPEDAAMAMVAALDPRSAQMIETRIPQLPPPANEPVTTLTRGLRNAIVTVQAPPQASAKLVAQATDEAAAQRLANLAERMLAQFDTPSGHERFGGEAAARALAQALRPTMQGNALVVDLGGPALRELAATALLPAMVQARASAMRVVSMSNLRQMAVAVHVYVQNHQNRLPASLDDIRQYLGDGEAAVETNPRGISDAADYIYLRPAETIEQVQRPSETPLVMENPDDLPEDVEVINVAYVDGHASAVPAAEARKLLEAHAGDEAAEPSSE